MNNKFTSFSSASLLFVAGLALDCDAAPPLYRVTEIGTFGGNTSVGLAINARGDVWAGREPPMAIGTHSFLLVACRKTSVPSVAPKVPAMGSTTRA